MNVNTYVVNIRYQYVVRTHTFLMNYEFRMKPVMEYEKYVLFIYIIIKYRCYLEYCVMVIYLFSITAAF